MIKDFQNQPTFGPKSDVALFIRDMSVVYDCHVKFNGSLEMDFVTLVEQQMATTYRVDLQKH